MHYRYLSAAGVLATALLALPTATVHAQEGGLSGPSSVGAELTPGDGLTDPQFRSDFPRNIAPAWFDWKDMLAEDYGLKFSIDYLALGQWSNAAVAQALNDRAKDAQIDERKQFQYVQ